MHDLGMQILDPEDRQSIGKALRQARKDCQLTQTELAELSGIQQGEISRIERGARDIPLPWLSELAKALNCTISIAIAPRV